MTIQEKLEEMFKVAVSEWEAQGRSFDDKVAVRNFLTGRAIGLRNDLEALIQEEVTKGKIQELCNWANFFEDPNMNAMTPSERLEDRIEQLKGVSHE